MTQIVGQLFGAYRLYESLKDATIIHANCS